MAVHPDPPGVAILCSNTLACCPLKDTLGQQATSPDIWVRNTHSFDSEHGWLGGALELVVPVVRTEGPWPCGCTGGARMTPRPPPCSGLLFGGIAGSGWGGGSISDIHCPGQPPCPAVLLALAALAAGASPHSPCALPSHLRSSRVAPEASPRVRSLPVCLSRSGSDPAPLSFLRREAGLPPGRQPHTHGRNQLGREGSHCTVVFKLCCHGAPLGTVLVAGGAGLTHWSRDTFP